MIVEFLGKEIVVCDDCKLYLNDQPQIEEIETRCSICERKNKKRRKNKKVKKDEII